MSVETLTLFVPGVRTIRKTNTLIVQTCLNQDYGFINNENIDRMP